MSIPKNITDELNSLQTQVNANLPLTSAPRPTVIAMQLNADQLVADVEAAQTTLAGAIDTWVSPIDPVAIINGVLGVYMNAIDEANIVFMRGIVGRVASNLNQLGPTSRPPVLLKNLPYRIP